MAVISSMLAIMLASYASATQVSRGWPSSVPCQDKTRKVLVRGGQLQDTVGCNGLSASEIHNRLVAAKEQRERDAYRSKQEAERKKKKKESEKKH